MTKPRVPGLLLDAGQSGSRATRAVGSELIEMPALITDEPVVEQLADRVWQATRTLGAVGWVAIGSSALPDAGGAAELLGLLPPEIQQVWLAHDSVTNYLAALGPRQGVVVAAGTGVVTLAVGDSEIARVDGWGYLIGDAGSAFWMGRAGLDAVMRAHDGRGPATALANIVRADVDDLSGLYLDLQQDETKVARIASYARRVSELASTDAVCRQICLDAAAELAHSALTGLARVGLASQPNVAVGLAGKVFSGATVNAEFRRLVTQQHPDAEFDDSTAGNLAGVALLPTLPADSPLTSRVDRASRRPQGDSQ